MGLQIIECEAGGESYEGKIGVGAVILNRIRSSEFPNTLSEVIYQSGQFEPVWTGKLASVLSRGANADCYAAARDVFAGANTIGECLFHARWWKWTYYWKSDILLNFVKN